MENKNKFKNIIFDWSGVVNDSNDRHFRVVNMIFKEFGVNEISMEELKENWVQPYMRFYEKYIPNITEKEEYAVYCKILPKAGKCNSYPGMVQLIKKLHKDGKNLIVISSDLTETIRSEIKDFGLEDIFKDVISDVHDKTGELNKIIRNMNLNLSETVFIGDSNHEIEAGKREGIKTIAVTWGFSTKRGLMMYKPDFIVDSVSELEECLCG